MASAADSKLAISIREALRIVPPLPKECCIYKVPMNLRSLNEAAYTPKIISIGPIHHGEPRLQRLEVQKRRYLDALLDQNPAISLDDCVRFLRGLEGRVRDNYYQDQFPSNFSSDEFVTMMLLDSSFLIQFLFLNYNPAARDKYDLIFGSHQYYCTVSHDIMLLENQLPYFLLGEVFDFLYRPGTLSFFQLSANYYSSFCVAGYRSVHSRNSCSEVKHLLDFVLKSHLPSESRKPPKHMKEVHMPSATELQESGIKFIKGKGLSFLDVTFRDGVFEIPTLAIGDDMESSFRNMIAVEQCHPGNTSHITDYMILMDSLINTQNDVVLLRSCGIIKNTLGNDHDVAQLFTNILKGVCLKYKESHYSAIFQDVNVFYSRRWNVWKAKLRRDYFNTPWGIISLNAALILLVCTLIQAVCSILSLSK